MNKPKHTPGPWRSGDAFHTVFGPKDNPVTVATVFKGNAANARLIAAAPELLEVARMAFDAIAESGIQDEYIDVANALSEIIFRAGGNNNE